MYRNNQNDLNFSPQEVGFGSGGYSGAGAPVIAPTFISTPSGPSPYSYAPPIAPVAPIFGGGFGNGNFGNSNNLIELLIASQLFGRNGFGGPGNQGGFPFPEHCKDDNNGNLALLAAIAGSKDATVGEGRGVLAAIASSKDTTVAEARALSAAICDAEKTNLQQFYAAAIQASNNTQSIKDQSSNETALILARINESDTQRLRDELFNERRGRDRSDLDISIQNTNTNVQSQFQAQAQAQLQRDFDEHRRRYDNREIEINNINTNTNVQSQLQAQAQAQLVRDFEHNRRFDALFSQNDKVAQDIINVGSGVVGAAQTANPTNVNSKNNQ